MSENQITKTSASQLSVKDLFAQPFVKDKMNELLGKRSSAFMTSVLQIVASNTLLSDATPASIYNAALVAASLNLPLNNNLGFAYIVPYSNKGVREAQFQMGYKGFIQLAQRSGQMKKISASRVCEGQIISADPLRGYEFDWSVQSDTIVGYVAYFQLTNGFEAELYMTLEELKAHGTRFSQTFKKGFGLWKDDFDSMAKKTVIKLLLSKYAPLSVEMEQAVIADQSVINNADTLDIKYVDNTPSSIDEINDEKQIARIKEAIDAAKNLDELYMVLEASEQYGLLALYDAKLESFKSNKA